MADKVMHYVNQSVNYTKKEAFETAMKLSGFVSVHHSETCKWYEVLVEAGSACDDAMGTLSISRKELK